MAETWSGKRDVDFSLLYGGQIGARCWRVARLEVGGDADGIEKAQNSLNAVAYRGFQLERIKEFKQRQAQLARRRTLQKGS